MKNSIKNLIAALIFFGLFLATVEYLSAGEVDDTALHLARSCVGETGFFDNEKECLTQWHIYQKLTPPTGTILGTAKAYSGSLKKGKHNAHRRWMFYLNRAGQKPLKFKNLDWDVYSNDWLRVLALADRFVAGQTEDPCVECIHYCGAFEIKLAQGRKLCEVKNLGLKNVYFKRYIFKSECKLKGVSNDK